MTGNGPTATTSSNVNQVNTTTGELLEVLNRKVDLSAAGPIAKRLALATLEIDHVAKRGRNEFHKYDYATAEDIKAAAREALAKHGLVIIPLMLHVEQSQAGKQIKTIADFEYVIACEEGTVSVPWTCEAYDTGDKGINKASTGGLKYFLINLLQIPIGDEPDADGEKQVAKPTTKPRQQKRQQARKSGNGKSGSTVTRPMTPAQLRTALQAKADKRGDAGEIPASEKQAPFVARKFQEAFGGDDDAEKKYHLSLEWLWEVDSAKKLTLGQAASTLDWLLAADGPDDTGDTPLHEHAPKEARHVWRESMKDAGQNDMFDEPEEEPVSA